MNSATVKGVEYFMNSAIVSRIFNINLIFKRGRNVHKKLKGGYKILCNLTIDFLIRI